jgi:hypothetical protein
MNDTVRDAVFGNVGTMVSFRVSADDAPVLGKQFEPQFEPNDLLQMHNRHFIINMVIKGEKAPAFSATTLALPSPQTDYTLQIIDNSRHTYARDRADVQQEIEALISSSTPQIPAQTPTMAKKWPIASSAKKPAVAPPKEPAAELPATTPSQPAAGQGTTIVHNQPSAASADDQAPKKRRSRSRRKKTGAAQDASMPTEQRSEAPRQAPAQRPAPKTQPKEDEFKNGTELRLR